MTHLPRTAKPAIFLALLVALVSLPVVWTQQAPWHGIAPALSHAGGAPMGGSPDETLKPASSPTGKFVPRPRLNAPESASTERTVVGARSLHGVRAVNPAWLLYTRLYLTALLRI